MDQKVGLALCAAAALLLTDCGFLSAEAKLRKQLATQTSGIIVLPRGVVAVSSELRLAPGTHDLEILGQGTTLRASDRFQGRAILVLEGSRRVSLHDFAIDGNRVHLAKPLDMAPPENAFRVWYPNNGILADKVAGLRIERVYPSEVAGFPILISESSDVHIREVHVKDSGSKNVRGRNNLSGGIVIEEGTVNFDVTDSLFERILGNALWTHSMSIAPQQRDGRFAGNRFDTIGRDAVQVGHALHATVSGNTGKNIGFPVDIVDVENQGIPTALDTSGDVGSTEYSNNTFEEVNGKCIDLDGFHDGAVRGNQCVNRKSANDYPFGQFGIAVNNSNPGMRSQNIEITGNVIDGAKYGGLFLIGEGHRVIDNRFVRVNLAGCHESGAACVYKPDEPAMLESGIYLTRSAARLQDVQGNVISGNQVSGAHMKARCIGLGPGVAARANQIVGNVCTDR